MLVWRQPKGWETPTKINLTRGLGQTSQKLIRPVRNFRVPGAKQRNACPWIKFGGQEMKIRTLILGSAATIMMVGGAQAADLAVASGVDGVKVCSAEGAGYFYIPGSDQVGLSSFTYTPR